MDRWTEVELFIQIAEQGSLSRAAEAVGVSNATASRLLAGLEERLAARLVQRNTRRLYLTDIGQDFYRRCKAIAGDMAEAEAAVNAASVNPSGTLTVTASLSCCLEHVVPLLPEFHRRYPDITVQIVAANRYYDIIDNNVDLAIRTREYEADSNITIRRLAEMRRILAASPEYLARNGVPAAPEDLADHRMLVYTYANRPDELRFTRRGRTQSVRIQPFLEANDGQILRNAALDGLGILIQPSYIVHDDVVAGRLVPVLGDYELPRLMMNIAYPSRRHLPAKVRAFIDFLVEDFRKNEYERRWLL
ncbi:LysR family transcriptional regulator [Burkholderiaceae bacterium FT117]|uniref:LysR family transcriptional regulator n=1 Tax=Zeimonas sediminis TaxID=2944268 RepID=UPI002342CF7A|nr:LysR family transcriptional regulator [Zeimonas sediminis]MCM5571536.1 LysR family transcriptional regulator [Zeimonas sediminis]